MPLVDEALAPESFAEASGQQQIDRALLQHAGAHALGDVRAASLLEHDRLEALEVQQVREHEPGGPATDDPDLGSQHRFRWPRAGFSSFMCGSSGKKFEHRLRKGSGGLDVGQVGRIEIDAAGRA